MEIGASLLWTALPVEMVVQGLEPDAPAAMEMMVEGRLLQVLPGQNGTGTVQRLLSTDPMDYLDPRWQPGTSINLTGI
ncbi:MAG TPA: YlzJ-like family protein [Symbiobacteriaceae bacterium]|nr:YlzJ-like family protein [Symbiobacteriaceae bacterium]